MSDTLTSETMRAASGIVWPLEPPIGYYEKNYTQVFNMTHVTVSPSKWFQDEIVTGSINKLPNVTASCGVEDVFSHEVTVDLLGFPCFEHEQEPGFDLQDLDLSKLDNQVVRQLHKEHQVTFRINVFQGKALGEFLIEFQKRRGDSCLFKHYYSRYLVPMIQTLVSERPIMDTEFPESLF